LAKDNCGKNMLMSQQDCIGGKGCLKGLGVRNKNGLRDRGKKKWIWQGKIWQEEGWIVVRVPEHSKEKTDYGKLEV
jgi:hypothetical protein